MQIMSEPPGCSLICSLASGCAGCLAALGYHRVLFSNSGLPPHKITFQSFNVAIKLGLKSLLQTVNMELIKNKTAELYLWNRDKGDANYWLEISIPSLISKYHYSWLILSSFLQPLYFQSCYCFLWGVYAAQEMIILFVQLTQTRKVLPKLPTYCDLNISSWRQIQPCTLEYKK